MPVPDVSAPVTAGARGQAFGALTPKDLPSGFIEEERFVSEVARSYTKAGSWGTDGVWNLTPAATAPYTVRILVRRPSDPIRFNGIVVVEWLNVTAQAEGAADYMQMHELLTRDGYAWVGVGAQSVGVNAPRTGLKAWDQERYASLVHPGDGYSYDIFSQVAQAIRGGRANAAPGTRRIDHVLATGRSQSAFRLVTYINAFHTGTKLFDGYLVHSRGSNAAGLHADALARDAEAPIPPGAHSRTDLDVPVLDLQAEGDMAALRSHLTRQEPPARYRRWDLAGAAHAETPRWVVEVPLAGVSVFRNATPRWRSWTAGATTWQQRRQAGRTAVSSSARRTRSTRRRSRRCTRHTTITCSSSHARQTRSSVRAIC